MDNEMIDRKKDLFEKYEQEYYKDPIVFIEKILKRKIDDDKLNIIQSINEHAEECEFLLYKMIDHEFMFMPCTVSLDEEDKESSELAEVISNV